VTAVVIDLGIERSLREAEVRLFKIAAILQARKEFRFSSGSVSCPNSCDGHNFSFWVKKRDTRGAYKIQFECDTCQIGAEQWFPGNEAIK
jgi:hypothetical protein